MCTLEKRGRVYLLTLTGPGEHRLNPSLLTSLRSALAQARSDPTAAALVTAGEGKFFSNGFDLAWAKSSPEQVQDRAHQMSSLLRLAVADLVSLPMPTVAAVTGHASAAGLILALAHDHVVVRADRGFLYMSETDIGLPIPAWFAELVRAKVADRRAQRDVLVGSRKVKGKVAVEMGMADRAVEGAEATVGAALRFGEELAGKNWDGKIYASNRMVLFSGICAAVGLAAESEEEKARIVSAKL